MHVSVGSVVVTEDLHAVINGDSWGINGHQNLRLAAMRRPVLVGLHHNDQDFTAGVTGTRGVIFSPVDYPFIAIQNSLASQIFSIRRCHIGFGHDVSRPDLPVKQRG